MAVYKRGNVYWYHFTFAGRRVQRSTKVGNAKDARDIERAYWNRLARHEVGLPEEGGKKTPPTISELLDHLEAAFKRGERRGKWSPRTESNFRAARAAFPASMKAESLTRDDVNKYIDKKKAKGRAPATINRAVGLIASAFKLGEIRGPKFPHLNEKGNARQGFFEDADFRKVHAHLPEDLKDFCLFAFLTAWRKGEVSCLIWRFLQNGVLRIPAEETKNNVARSVVVAGELTEIIERRNAARLSNGVLTDYIFHRNGQPILEFRKAWASACRKAGFADSIFHDLRRSGVRNMIRSGTPQSVAMKISGHETISMFKRYDICNEDDLRQASEALQRYHEATKGKVVSIAQ